MQQTLDNGTQSYGALLRDGEATSEDYDDLFYKSHERSHKKGLISDEDWEAYQERYAADHKTPTQIQPARKRGRPRKKHHS